nr:MAG TPA: hypothetical protein [Caudoviricetes sp.]
MSKKRVKVHYNRVEYSLQSLERPTRTMLAVLRQLNAAADAGDHLAVAETSYALVEAADVSADVDELDAVEISEFVLAWQEASGATVGESGGSDAS